MKKKLITIDPSKIVSWSKKASKLVFKKEAEKELIKLYQLKDTVDKQIELVKVAIATSGKSIMENFKGVIGENVRAVYRMYGEKYVYDKDKTAELTPFLKQVTFHKVDSKSIDEYLKRVGELPDGITEKDRQPTLSVTVKKESLLPKSK